MGDDLIEGLAEQGLLPVVQRELTVLGDIPVGKQLQLAAQQGFVIERQGSGIAGLGGQLPVQQHLDGGAVPGFGILGFFGVQSLDDGLAAQVAQQHEAMAGVPVQNLRHAQAGLVHQALNLGKRRAIFLVGRRVHDDQAAAIAAIQAQIAAKAGIGRSRAQGCGKQLVLFSQRCQPGVECGVAGRICPGNANCGGDRSGHG